MIQENESSLERIVVETELSGDHLRVAVLLASDRQVDLELRVSHPSKSQGDFKLFYRFLDVLLLIFPFSSPVKFLFF